MWFEGDINLHNCGFVGKLYAVNRYIELGIEIERFVRYIIYLAACVERDVVVLVLFDIQKRYDVLWLQFSADIKYAVILFLAIVDKDYIVGIFYGVISEYAILRTFLCAKS